MENGILDLDEVCGRPSGDKILLLCTVRETVSRVSVEDLPPMVLPVALIQSFGTL